MRMESYQNPDGLQGCAEFSIGRKRGSSIRQPKWEAMRVKNERQIHAAQTEDAGSILAGKFDHLAAHALDLDVSHAILLAFQSDDRMLKGMRV
jgi:hypothetical protein